VPRAFEQAGAGRVVTGASHHRDVATLRDGARRILNPGGVGQPRDGDPRAAYARLDAQSGTFTFMRVEYPISVTQRKILEAGLPPSLASRLSLGM
jgi:diadenosine tetraphosphatase ApaH/serine/threonine PP2A family protein phosphatase